MRIKRLVVFCKKGVEEERKEGEMRLKSVILKP